VKVERHWWNTIPSPRGRRDVYIRTDGHRWEVVAIAGGENGRSKTHPCPGRATAEILASAWRGTGGEWRELAPDDKSRQHSRQPFWPSSRAAT
jgi:hypothetical protein